VIERLSQPDGRRFPNGQGLNAAENESEQSRPGQNEARRAQCLAAEERRQGLAVPTASAYGTSVTNTRRPLFAVKNTMREPSINRRFSRDPSRMPIAVPVIWCHYFQRRWR